MRTTAISRSASGLSVPFGLETDYQPGWVSRYSALRTKLTTFDIQPTVVRRFLNRVSLGAGLDFNASLPV